MSKFIKDFLIFSAFSFMGNIAIYAATDKSATYQYFIGFILGGMAVIVSYRLERR